MGKPATLRVDVVTDGTKASRGIDQAESRFARFGRNAGKYAKLAGLGIAAGLGAAVAVGVKFAKMAAEDEAGASRLARTMKNVAGASDAQVASTERWITKQGQALGVADDDLRPALGRLVTATGSVSKAQKLASLAMDVSAGTGKSLKQVTEALARAQGGNTAGLARLGVATKDASGKALTLDQITANLAKTHAGAASTAANTAAGQYGRLKLMLSETAENIGGYLLPAATALFGWLTRMGPGVQNLAGNLGGTLGPILRRIGSFITDTVVPAARQFYGWFVDKIVPGIKRAVTPVLNGLRSAFANVQAAVQRNKPQLDQLKDVLGQVATFMATKVLPIIGRLNGVGFKVLGKTIGATIDLVAGLVTGIANLVSGIKKLIGWLGNIHVPKALTSLGSSIGGLFSAPVTHGVSSLVGQGVSYDDRRGFSRFAAGTSSMVSRLLGGRTAAPAAGGVVIDARTWVTIDGAMDEVSLATKLDAVLARHRRRMGRAA